MRKERRDPARSRRSFPSSVGARPALGPGPSLPLRDAPDARGGSAARRDRCHREDERGTAGTARSMTSGVKESRRRRESGKRDAARVSSSAAVAFRRRRRSRGRRGASPTARRAGKRLAAVASGAALAARSLWPGTRTIPRSRSPSRPAAVQWRVAPRARRRGLASVCLCKNAVIVAKSGTPELEF